MPRTGSSSRGVRPLSNGELAELLAHQAEQAGGHLQRAYKRAARAAFLWPIEAAELLRQNEPLSGLPGIGPYLERTLRSWIDEGQKPRNPPPLRADFLTLTEARSILASGKTWASRYRGDLQMHSRWSDGAGTIADMAEAAIARKYEYIAITDHSKGLKIAGGIDESALRKQGAEIELLNEQLRARGEQFRVLRSIEVNLNPRGETDLDPDSLKKLDLVVGSFHSRLRQQEDQTERYLAALRNPFIHILGHPRGRIYNHRLGLSADWPRVFALAAKLDKAIEVDSYPDRQDLDLKLLRVAKQEGVRIAIDTDAHSPGQLGFVELGLAAALQAKIGAERIVNFLKSDALLRWAKEGRR